MIATGLVCLVAATLTQAPADASSAWMKAVPAEADVVVHCRGIGPAARELGDMLKAMSPTAAENAAPMLTQFVDQWKAQFGEDVVAAPFVGLVRAEAPGPDGIPPFAVLVMKDDYRTLLKALNNGRAVTPKAEAGGFDSFANPFGEGSWYAFDGDGFNAFGPDKALIAGVAKPGDRPLSAKLSPALAKALTSGDLGVYVDAARLASRYEEQIVQARQAFMAALDQAAERAPQGASMDFVKTFYGSFFDSLKDAEGAVLNFDFAADGLLLGGRLDVKAGASSAPSAAGSLAVPAEIDKLDPSAMIYVVMNMNAADVQKWQNLSMRMIAANQKISPDVTRAMESFKNLGRLEVVGATSMGDGIRTFNVAKTTDPKAYIAATEATIRAMKGTEGPLSFYKDVKIEPDAQKHRGVSYSHITVTFDLEKLAAQGQELGEEAAARNLAMMKSMFGGDTMSYWTGVDGGRVIQVTGRTWDEAAARLDHFFDGKPSVGQLESFQKVRADLGDQANILMILQVQSFVRFMAKQLATTSGRADLKVPEGLTKAPAFLGGSLKSGEGNGYDLRLSIPSSVGPVVEQGLIPLFRQVAAPPAQ